MAGDLNEVTGTIIDSAIRIHRDLGPGLLESVCESVLARHLVRRGLQVERQVLVSFDYDGLRFEQALRIDLLVQRQVVVEVKSQERLAPVHARQVLTYLKLMNLPIGLLINFGDATLKSGLKRIIHDCRPTPSL